MTPATAGPEATAGSGHSTPLLDELFAPRMIDRRRWPRRSCAPIRVFVAELEAPARLWQGCVLDSSPGGLGLKLIGPMPAAGTLMRVSRCSVPALEASVRIRVVHARQDKNCCVIGCEFAEKPSPSVLVLFS